MRSKPKPTAILAMSLPTSADHRAHTHTHPSPLQLLCRPKLQSLWLPALQTPTNARLAAVCSANCTSALPIAPWQSCESCQRLFSLLQLRSQLCSGSLLQALQVTEKLKSENAGTAAVHNRPKRINKGKAIESPPLQSLCWLLLLTLWLPASLWPASPHHHSDIASIFCTRAEPTPVADASSFSFNCVASSALTAYVK